MRRTWRVLRLSAAAVTLSGLVTGTAGLTTGSQAQAGYGQVQATTGVNIRSGPGTSYARLGVLQRGQQLQQVAAPRGEWIAVSYRGKTAWIHGNYLTGASQQAMVSGGGGKGTAVTTERLNARTGPSTRNAVVTTLPRGTRVTLTGSTSGKWWQIALSGSQRWVYSSYLSISGQASSTATAKVVARARATTALMIRTSSSSSFRSLGDVSRGTALDLTGKRANGVSQIVWQGALRWVNSRYLASVSATSAVAVPAAQKTVGTRYATTALDIRTTSGSTSVTLTEVPAGTALAITGVVQNGRAQIVYQKAVRWVTARYLRTTATPNTAGSSGLSGLQPSAKSVLARVQAAFPQISTFHGVRPGIGSDHATGRAVDAMLPDYRNNNALGWQIAKELRADARRLGIHYIIFDAHIWNIQRDAEGWRAMADRGSDNANHRNHVHTSVY